MAVIERSGTVRHNPRLLEGPQAGEIDSTLARFAELEPLFGPADTTDCPQWVILVESPDDRPAARVSLYYLDSTARDHRAFMLSWGIGARREDQWAADRVKAVIAQYREAEQAPAWVRVCDHDGCVITAPHKHGAAR